MNKVYNESSKEVTVVGDLYSHAYNKEVFNITLPKLIEKLWSNWNRGGLERHTDPDELYMIMTSEHVHGVEERRCLYQSAYFYFDKERTNINKRL